MTLTALSLNDRVNIPAPYSKPFMGGIRHPLLWLWDSWVYREKQALHLYCLALARQDQSGNPIMPHQFNDYPFHYRHFVSTDDGQSWHDQGAALMPGSIQDGSDAGNVWSGGVHPLPNGQVLFAYTGISHASSRRQFVQSIIISEGDASGPDTFPTKAQSHPIRDREAILAAGYYLPDEEQIGSNDGEDGGPILAWRDPHIFEDASGTLHCLWSAKVGPTEPAVAHAILEKQDQTWVTHLQPPILLPDADEYTQSEVPKICRNAVTGELLMMISSCDRISEQQPDSEITKNLRLYQGQTIRGPWESVFEHGSIIQGIDHHFGASFIDPVAEHGTLRLVSPYTVKAGECAMTFAPIRTIRLG